MLAFAHFHSKTIEGRMKYGAQVLKHAMKALECIEEALDCPDDKLRSEACIEIARKEAGMLNFYFEMLIKEKANG